MNSFVSHCKVCGRDKLRLQYRKIKLVWTRKGELVECINLGIDAFAGYREQLDIECMTCGYIWVEVIKEVIEIKFDAEIVEEIERENLSYLTSLCKPIREVKSKKWYKFWEKSK